MLIKKKFNVTLIVNFTFFKLQQQITRNKQLIKQFIIIKNNESNEIKNDCKNHRIQLQHAKKIIRNFVFLLNNTNIVFLRLTITNEQIV